MVHSYSVSGAETWYLDSILAGREELSCFFESCSCHADYKILSSSLYLWCTNANCKDKCSISCKATVSFHLHANFRVTVVTRLNPLSVSTMFELWILLVFPVFSVRNLLKPCIFYWCYENCLHCWVCLPYRLHSLQCVLYTVELSLPHTWIEEVAPIERNTLLPMI
jgi:hypothetical protein